MTKQPATYVTIWDAVSVVRTNCMIDTSHSPPFVSDIESVDDVAGLADCNEEYVEVNGEKILTFLNEDLNILVVDGMPEEQYEEN